jgi:hypothetical protein
MGDKKKINDLVKSFLLHETPFEGLEYLTPYDRYKKYIEEESTNQIIDQLASYQKSLLFEEETLDRSTKELIDTFETIYLKENPVAPIDLPEALHRVKRKDLRLLISQIIPGYFKDFRYDHKPFNFNDPRSIVFSKKEKDHKLVIDFNMGVYGAGLWCNIFIGRVEPEIKIDLAPYMPFEMISYDNLEDCQRKLKKIFELLKAMSQPFFNVLLTGEIIWKKDS